MNRQTLINNVVALCKTAKLYELPIILSTERRQTARDGCEPRRLRSPLIQSRQQLGPQILVLLEGPMHHIHLHDGIDIPDTARHSAHMFAINQNSDSQGLNHVFNKRGKV